MCHYKSKNEEIKINTKIFRPWDTINQDATVSTTTTEIVEEKLLECLSKKETLVKKSELITITKGEEKGFRPIISKNFRQDLFPIDYPTACPVDLFQTPNLAHNLGLAANDQLFLESMAQGYALEEYARVLSQEHQAKILNSRKQRPKKYKCPHCDVGFSNNGQLKGHIRIHTGERPFKCDEKDCGKTFTRNEELTRHKRIHSGLRPFPCTHCGKRFGRKDHLKKHSRTHFQARGLYAVPVMLPYDTCWTAAPVNYPYASMYGF